MTADPDDPDDTRWLEEHAEFDLAFHDADCVAQATADAFAIGIDDDDGARQVAAQLLKDGDSPCRCQTGAS